MLCRLVLVVIPIIIFIGGCNFPRDPNNTLNRVRGGTLRVGVVEHRPWVNRLEGDEPAGVEVELVRNLANELDASVQWIWGTEQVHLEALERYELDLAIMGLSQTTPWQTRVGLSQPYYVSRIMIGIPASMRPPQDLNGLVVAVKEGSVVAAYLEEEDARPLRVDNPAQVDSPAAAATWQLKSWGLTVTDIELHTEKYVMALPPGENAWLAVLDTFLANRQTQVEQALQHEALP